MSAAMLSRVMKLERILPMPDGQRAALIVIHGSDRDPAALIGVHGLDLRRLPDESAGQFIERVETHVRATRGRSPPRAGFLLALLALDLENPLTSAVTS